VRRSGAIRCYGRFTESGEKHKARWILTAPAIKMIPKKKKNKAVQRFSYRKENKHE
jgi:hypothetical protein